MTTITIDGQLLTDVRHQLASLTDDWEHAGAAMPGWKWRRKKGARISLSELVERLLRDWDAAMDDVWAGKRPRPIGRNIRLPRDDEYVYQD